MLGSNAIGDEGFAAVGSVIRERPLAFGSLELLSLSNNKVGDDGVAALASALQEPAAGAAVKLQQLYLWGNLDISERCQQDAAAAVSKRSVAITF